MRWRSARGNRRARDASRQRFAGGSGKLSDLGEISPSPHRHLCAKNVRMLGVSGEEPGAYGPGMRQMARYLKHYTLQEFVTHRFGLRDVETAVKKSIEPESMKVVLEPWR